MELLEQYSSDEEGGGSDDNVQGAPQLIRNFPHVDGNYSTHVYISVKVPDSALPGLRRLIHKAKSGLEGLQSGHDNLPANNQAIADIPDMYHISLSRVVPIRYKDVELLLISLRSALESMRRFEVRLSELQAFTNAQHTRSFLALRTSTGEKQVCKIIDHVNQAFVGHGLPVFHEDPQPHISVAWILGDHEARLREWIQSNPQAGAVLTTKVESVWCKIGNKVHNIWKA